MFKTTTCPLLIFLFLLDSFSCLSQCISPPAAPACTGTESVVLDNEVLLQGTTKWYYGSPATYGDLTLKGGTLVVCGDLTINRFYMDSGTIYIRPGARFVIGSGIGAGLILAGNSSIYNYGTLEIQRNLSLENGYASAVKPNRIINASTSSVFRMSNQYFVINNQYSWFVNNGTAEFWGIITDAQSSPNSVCLGAGSTTKMAVLINKIADTYVAPSGNACVYVFQLSQFNNKLTSSYSLSICLSSGHNSYSGCGGCPANNWGTAQVFTSCSGCAALSVLASRFISLDVKIFNGTQHRLDWKVEKRDLSGVFTVLRSANGVDYYAIDSLKPKDENTTQFTSYDKNPVKGNNFYMINYSAQNLQQPVNSNPVRIQFNPGNDFSVFPMPFENRFYIQYNPGERPGKIILTDIVGQNIPIHYSLNHEKKQVEVLISVHLVPGVYIIHMRTDKSNIAQTIIKQ